ncbi:MULTISPECIES: tRNA (pseudouridine(54)-N(1))-methyltransferase TrmY [Vibrio oreintalis group]|uniref:Putative pseudouridine methyltransferase n=2 Tax=Vibrio oreintalis group TaxID=1891919 RepID=A0AAE5GMQ9_9VIBR|nr:MULTISPECIES: tRNA (pseudouridine(54)-N(1))-methyltransferase TrmY [Vibrio oreintalis group]MCG9577008.1 tRNA (pseudouridine(54)-N(1))-methyltransferase TrmY [Vibrio tubiashii]MDC5818770.1 tRNA (pseudouridine(54)-N(1))-methyltransferase TrmY [Vibrio europaeus]MDC5856788.1 tRNA (pseudouridine(54)-N(1))-methyltransferase TrmY [Vibrio europaeus]MDC5871206.1 tRNA (pseudouridine(54)-N(1))-methyltransferase TrmY [Vibrio europaeus]NOH21787.1 tRNA (pseudouridine(54)-N(1))-methyltransferase TrmY [Vi
MNKAFVIRARAASTDHKVFVEGVGGDAHSEILAHVLMNAIFTAQSHRDDVKVYLVIESTADFSRTLCFESSQLSNIGGFHESALIALIAKALEHSVGMKKEELRNVAGGLSVETISFEKLVQRLAEDYTLYLLDKKGTDIRDEPFDGNACFILTDHIPMPKKSWNSLKRLGTQKVSLGPQMLFASQCIVLIHNEFDRRG